jgi:aspartate racemase
MKTIGIVGGIGPESTIEYYHHIIAAYRGRVSDGSLPQLIINSINAKSLFVLITERQYAGVTRLLLDEIARLARAGAELGLLAANTPHIVFDDISAQSPIPLVSIVEAACDAAADLSLTKVGLIGTQLTMESQFYSEVFSRKGISIVVPEADDRNFVHEKYMGELFHGVIRRETRDELIAIVRRLRERHQIDGMILGGTELSLILTDASYGGIPVLDTTRIHAERVVAEALA